MARIALDGVTLRHADGTVAVRDLTLAVEDGEFLVLVGPSGCGKTTVLRMVAGLDTVTAGTIRIGDRIVNDLPPRDRDVAMVFQSYALYPHMTVFENLAFALRLRKMARAEIDRRVEGVARQLGLDGLLGRSPRQLSGGQRQRVAMGRAIVREPAAFLMDEPLSNLDAKLRVQMRAELAELQQRLRATTLYVTHDQIEAMTMGARVAVMRHGALQQVDTPQVLHEHPCNLFVAGFIGAPAMNLLPARLEPAPGDGVRVCIGACRLPVPAMVLAASPALRTAGGRDVVCGIRPQDVHATTAAGDASQGSGTVATATAPGASGSRDAAAPLRGRVVLAEPHGGGPLVHAEVEGVGRMTARLEGRTLPARGTTLVLGINTARLYLFDPETEAGIAWPANGS